MLRMIAAIKWLVVVGLTVAVNGAFCFVLMTLALMSPVDLEFRFRECAVFLVFATTRHPCPNFPSLWVLGTRDHAFLVPLT